MKVCSRLLWVLWLLVGAHPVVGQADWPTYGGSAGGQRYAAAAQITPLNVQHLQRVWEYHTHALEVTDQDTSEAAFEATPILHGRTLYLSTPFDEVIALDAASGVERWRYKPPLAKQVSAGVVTSRGVAYWQGPGTGAVCAARVYIGTLDGGLIAVDAATGKVCRDFGEGGGVDLKKDLPTQKTYPYQEYGLTSPATVVGDVVVVGSAIADGQEVDVEPGVVRGYDARSGKLLWTWDPMPWARGQAVRTGGGNTWSVIPADEERGLVYLPTGSPSADFYGGMRVGDDRDADSVVAVDARTGKRVWAFQVVHHNLWDYDVAAEPLLFEYQGKVPAIAINTKMGMVFVLNRVTGQPIFPVEERPVPQTDVPGEKTSPTQPFSSLPPLSELSLYAGDLAGNTVADAQVCAARLSALRDEGIYTPPSLRGSLLYPGSLGGVNWGSPAFDPETGVMYVNSNHHAFRTRLLPRWRYNMDQIAGLWKSWEYAAGSLLVVVLLLRRSMKPGWIGGGAVVLRSGERRSRLVPQARVSVMCVISEGQLRRKGRPTVPIPRLTYSCMWPNWKWP